MPKGEHLKGKGGKKFTAENQPENRRQPKPKFIDLLEEISANEGKMQFDKFKIVNLNGKDIVEIQLPNDMAMAIKVWNMAIKDVRWFKELALIRSLYAPNKNETLIKGVDVIEIIRNEDKS